MISGLSILVATLIAIPIGLFIGHRPGAAGIAINLANIGRAIPSYAMMVIPLPFCLALAPVIGIDPTFALVFLPIFLAMTFLAIPPLLVSTYAGLRSVDRDLIEAGRGMGLTERQILGQIEIPIASSIIVGGFRTATLQVIATETIGAILGGGGLGRFIFDGLNQGRAGRRRSGPARSSSLPSRSASTPCSASSSGASRRAPSARRADPPGGPRRRPARRPAGNAA